MSIDNLITQIIAREGGAQYTNRASDKGGPTKYGITLATLSASRGRATAEEVQALGEAEARAIYRKMYVEDPGFLKITDDGLQELLVDWGVNSGPGTAVTWLQMAVGVAVDGVLGPNTLNAIERITSPVVYSRVAKQRLRFYVRLALGGAKVRAFRKDNRDTDLENLEGWCNRAMEFL